MAKKKKSLYPKPPKKTGLRAWLRRRKLRTRRSLAVDIALMIFLGAFGLFSLFPLIYTVVSAFKPMSEIFIFPPKLTVDNPTLDNFFDLSFIAGLQTVDRAMYEAGAVEGIKNRWQELWYITLPAMKPQLMFGAVMQITNSFSVSQISLDLVGFPSVNYAGHTIMTHLHDFGNLRYEMGYACTIAVFLFLLMLFCNILVQKVLRKIG